MAEREPPANPGGDPGPQPGGPNDPNPPPVLVEPAPLDLRAFALKAAGAISHLRLALGRVEVTILEFARRAP